MQTWKQSIYMPCHVYGQTIAKAQPVVTYRFPLVCTPALGQRTGPAAIRPHAVELVESARFTLAISEEVYPSIRTFPPRPTFNDAFTASTVFSKGKTSPEARTGNFSQLERQILACQKHPGHMLHYKHLLKGICQGDRLQIFTGSYHCLRKQTTKTAKFLASIGQLII